MEGRKQVLHREVSTSFYSPNSSRAFPPFPEHQVGAVEGEVDSGQILKKACLDGTLIGMTRRGQGQGGDPVRPLGEKQWVTLVPK